MYAFFSALIVIQICFQVCFGRLSGLSYLPHTGNIAVGRNITASSTCGQHGPEEYCPIEAGLRCSTCNSPQAHPPSHMIDGGDSIHSSSRTWWQSARNTSNVQVDVDFLQMFFFTHVLISFKSIRPAAMVLEKSSDHGATYSVLQYYSSNCEQDFGLPDTSWSRDELGQPSCTSKYSQATAGEVVYTTISSQAQLDLSNSSLVDFLTITNLRIRLLDFHSVSGNSNGGIVIEAAAVRRYYAIYNVEVFGWCFCNGHETDCQHSEELGEIGIVPSLCLCADNTTGQYCEQCLPLSNHSPWEPGFQASSTGCQACECNGYSESCTYSEDRSGGICNNCSGNTIGDHCELCISGYFRNPNNTCEECQCNGAGTVPNTVCGQDGVCSCKDNVTGIYCDQCKPGHFNLSPDNIDGCQECYCNGSDCEPHTGRCSCATTNDPSCCSYDEIYDNTTGTCVLCNCHPNRSINVCDANATCICKVGVGGRTCDTCLPGYHSLTEIGCSRCSCNRGSGTAISICNNNTVQCECLDGTMGFSCDTCPDGKLGPTDEAIVPCIDCYCSGYSGQCTSQTNWYQALIVDKFTNESHVEDWSSDGSIEYIPGEGLVAQVYSNTSQTLSIAFPAKYLGDKSASFKSYVSFDMSINSEAVLSAQLRMSGRKTRRSQVKLSKSLGSIQSNHSTYKIDLIPDGFTEESFFAKNAREKDMHVCLSRLALMELLVTFVPGSPVELRRVAIDNVTLPYSTLLDPSNPDILYPLRPSLIVEACQCPMGRYGPSCEACITGFTHDPPNDEDQFLTCVKCYCYGHSSKCDSLTGHCINCQNNTAGRYCDSCADGYCRETPTSDCLPCSCPDGYYRETPTSDCLPCSCPGGLNTTNQFAVTCHYVGRSVVCDCMEGYAGARCERCDVGYVGSPSLAGGSCRVCACNNNTVGGVGGDTCNNITGQCMCSDGYTGITCHLCDLGYHGNALEHNCIACDCHASGTVGGTYCDFGTGLCLCKDNVEGDQCDQCSRGYWSIEDGCLACNCTRNAISCDQVSGECVCGEGYSGIDCGECADGYWNNSGNCTVCDLCTPPASVPPYCDKSTGWCLCLPGVTGERCSSCLPMGTTGILPYCTPCDECSAQWNVPMAKLEDMVMDYINLTGRLVPILVPYTQHEAGPELIMPLLDGLDNISVTLTNRDVNRVLNDSIDLYNYVSMLHNSTLITIRNAHAINAGIISENGSINLLLTDIESTLRELDSLSLLYNMTLSEIEAIVPVYVSDYIIAVEQYQLDAANLNATRGSIAPRLMEISKIQDDFFMKEPIFLSLSNETSNMSQYLEEKVLAYRNFMLEADSYICGRQHSCGGSVDLLCGGYGDSGRCNDVCGGVECDSCGGGACDHIMRQIEQARNVSLSYFQQASMLRENILIIMDNLSNITQMVLEDATATVQHIRETQNISNQLTSDMQLTVLSLEAILNDSRNDTNRIEAEDMALLELTLPYTPDEVFTLLQLLNDTVRLFPEISVRDEEELVLRIMNALNGIDEANNTYLRLANNVSRLAGIVQDIQNSAASAGNTTLQAAEMIDRLDLTITEIEVFLDLVNQTIRNISREVAAVQSYYEVIARRSETNNQTLNQAIAQHNRNLEWTTLIVNSDVAVKNLKNQSDVLSEVANATLVNMGILYDRMIALQNRTHTQMLEARGLYNRRKCLLTRQEEIYQQLLRLYGEIDDISDAIEPEVGRNTLCMRGTSIS